MSSLTGQKIAVLVSRGFSEQDVTTVQREFLEAGAMVRIISSDHGLVNGWNGREWGHHYAVDCSLSSALGADYNMLVVPGGVRSLDKLRLTAHTRRFLNSFMASGKPVVIMGDALGLAVFCDQVAGRTVGGPVEIQAIVERHGGVWSENTHHIDGNLMTGVCDAETRGNFVSEMMEFLSSRATMLAAA